MATIKYNLNGKRKRKEDDDDNVETRSRIDDLNDTLLELIFRRLSLWRYLATSKCVSKRWKSIISNPDFTRQLPPQCFPFTLFLSKGEYGEGCLVTEHPYFQKHKLHFNFVPYSDVHMGYNDLFLAYKHINSQKGEFYVANPLTKKYVVIPTALARPITQYNEHMGGIAGFVDGVSTINVSPRNNHGFRIVHILSEYTEKTVQIYSSETGQWKIYSFESINYCPLKTFTPAITWNNKIHWMQGSTIVVIDPFNINNVAPRVLYLPFPYDTGNSSSVLSVCQNRLRRAQFEKTWSNRQYPRIKIWEIEEDYDSTLVIDIKLKKSLIERTFQGTCRYDRNRYHKIVCCHPNDPQVLYFCYDGKLFYCNVVEKLCKRIGNCTDSWTDAFAFVHPP